MSTVSIDDELKHALETRAARAGLSLDGLLRRVVGLPTLGAVEDEKSAADFADTAAFARRGAVGRAAAQVLDAIPVPEADATIAEQSDAEFSSDLKRELSAAYDEHARAAGI